MKAFKDLGSERRNTMDSVGKIPRSMIKEYMRDHDFRGDDLYDAVWIMQEVDQHYTDEIMPMLNKRKRSPG